MSATVFSLPSAALPPQRPGTPGQSGAGAATRGARESGPAFFLHAARVYVTAALEVAIFGEYAEEAGIRRR